MRAALLALAVAACACAGKVRTAAHAVEDPAPYATAGIRTAVESSYRVAVACGETLVTSGSAVAVSDHALLTARHVAEAQPKEPCPVPLTFYAFDHRGQRSVVAVNTIHPTADAALLVGGPFKTYAKLATGEARVGDQVFMNAGTLDTFMLLKSGLVSRYATDSAGTRMLVLSIAMRPGNSGGGVFAASGALLGVAWGGRWEHDEEARAVAVAASELVFP